MLQELLVHKCNLYIKKLLINTPEKPSSDTHHTFNLTTHTHLLTSKRQVISFFGFASAKLKSKSYSYIWSPNLPLSPYCASFPLKRTFSHAHIPFRKITCSQPSHPPKKTQSTPTDSD